MSTASIRDTFFEECEELLEALSDGLDEMQAGDENEETINSVFRAVHSIKGGAGAFGLGDLVGFAHSFETVLDGLRSGDVQFDKSLCDLALRSSDQLCYLVEASRDGAETNTNARSSLLAELDAFLASNCLDEEEEIEFQPMSLDLDGITSEDEAEENNTNYAITFRPYDKLYSNGHEPLFMLRELVALGNAEITADQSAVPPVDMLDPDCACLGWTIQLSSEEPLERIQAVFEFVEGLCNLDINCSAAKPSDDVGFDLELPVPLPEDDDAIAILTDDAPETATIGIPMPDYSPKKGEQAKTAKSAPKEIKALRSTLRVDPERVDRLINTVGELIINQAMLTQRVTELDGVDIRDIEHQLEDYKTLARDLQEDVMGIRAQPVKPLFQRMARIVREAASATGKNVRLEMDGEGTEVDKTLIERLADPMTHMVRNAIDHGLETSETRLASGKDETGILRLRAAHRSGSVFISISDDGAGLNRKKILEIATSRGLVPEDAELSDTEIDNLLFKPGFSTAEEVSSLSGRGVGMDVVKNAVSSLGGRMTIDSEPGEGTTFSIILPLTMAVLDGMVVIVGDQRMVLPISSIIETIRPDTEKLHMLDHNSPVYAIRDSFVPIIDLAWNLGLSEAMHANPPSILLLVTTETHGRCALAVDSIVDQRQVVIKSLDDVYKGLPGVSAATILGDGRVALILDAEGIAQITPPKKQLDFISQDLPEAAHERTA